MKQPDTPSAKKEIYVMKTDQVKEEKNQADSQGLVTKDNESNAVPSFTPGPWEIVRETTDDGVPEINIKGDGWYVAIVCEGVSRNEDISIDDAPANARLIAAAPDLYTALKAITMIAGNLPDETLESCGGINEGRGRALMALSARSIARKALALVDGQDTASPKASEQPNK